MSRRTHSLNAYEVGLTSSISDVDTSFPVESVAGLVAPGYLVIDPDDPTLREYFKFTSINGSNLEMTSTAFRGLTGSAAGAQAHASGARVRAVAVGQWLEDIFSDIEDLEAEQAAFLLLDGTRAMTGALDMGTNKIINLGLPTLADDATPKTYVDAEDLTFLKLDGTRPMTAALNMGGFPIENLINSALDDGAVTKKYIDDADTALDNKIDLYLPLTGGTLTGLLSGTTIELIENMIVGPAFPTDAHGYFARREIAGANHEYKWVPGTSGGGNFAMFGEIDGGGETILAYFGHIGSYVAADLQLFSGRAYSPAGTTLTLEEDGGATITLASVTLVESIAGTDLTSLSFNGLDFLNTAAPFLRSADGVQAAPAYAFSGDKDSGFYRVGADQIGMAAGGVQVYFAGINFSYLPLAITNIRWQGIASIGSTGSAPNMFINTTAGNWARSTSAARYKSNIDYNTDHLADLDLKPVTYHHDGDDADYIGFIADDVADLDERMGQFNEEGIIENFETEAVVAILAAKTRRLELAVEALTNA